MPENPTYQVNFFDFLAFLLRWRKVLLTLILVVGVGAGVYSFLVQPKYRATAMIRAQEAGSPGIGALIASKLGSMGGFSGLVPSLGQVPEETYVNILGSRWMCERVIESFNLRKAYKMNDAPPEQLERTLLANTRFQLDENTMAIEIFVQDTDPKRAKEMVDFYIDELDRRNQDLKSSTARREREFIGQRLDAERGRLTAYEDSLYRFQIATGVLNVEEQVKATIQTAAVLEAQRLETQTELEMNKQVLGPSSPQANLSRIRLGSIDSTLQNLVRKRGANERSDFLVRLQDTPGQGMAYLRLMRDIEVQQLLVAYLIQQFEQAKVEELRNTPTVMRIDPPTQPTVRIWPKRSVLVGLAMFAAFVIGLAICMLVETLDRVAKDPDHPQYPHLQALRRSISGHAR
jgi:tyrosine-protein kinase Etk/Wzc